MTMEEAEIEARALVTKNAFDGKFSRIVRGEGYVLVETIINAVRIPSRMVCTFTFPYTVTVFKCDIER